MEDDGKKRAEFQGTYEKRRNTMISGGLVTISVVVLQVFISAGKLDVAETLSVICLAVAIPMLAGCTVYYCLFMGDYHFKNKKKISALFYCGLYLSGGGVGLALYHVSMLAALFFLVSVLVTSTLVILSTMSFKVFFRTLYFEYILRAIRGKVS